MPACLQGPGSEATPSLAREVGSLVQHELEEELRGEGEEALEAHREVAVVRNLTVSPSPRWQHSPGLQTLTSGLRQT